MDEDIEGTSSPEDDNQSSSNAWAKIAPKLPPGKNNYDYPAKVLLVGPSGAGKSSVFRWFQDGKFIPDIKPTIGVEFGSKIITTQGIRIRLVCWDTAGQERFQQIWQSYYQGSQIVFIVADITKDLNTNKAALEPFLKNIPDNAIKVLVVNKDDLDESKKLLNDDDIVELAKHIFRPKPGHEADSNREHEQAYVMSAKTGACHRVTLAGREDDSIPIEKMFANAAAALLTVLQDEREQKEAQKAQEEIRARAAKQARFKWLKILWNGLTGSVAGGFILAGASGAIVLVFLMAFGVMAPFSFLGFGGALAIAVSALFVFEAAAGLAVLTFCCSTGGPSTLKNTLSYAARHWFSGKLWLFLGGGAVLAVLLLLMAPGFPLATAALPLFTSSAIVGSAVLMITFLVGYTVLAAVAERVIALGFVAAINRARGHFRAAADSKASDKGMPLRTVLRGLGGHTVLPWITGESEHEITCCLNSKEHDKPLSYRFWPAVAEAAITGKDVAPSSFTELGSGGD